MPESIRRHLRSKEARAQSLILQWKTKKNAGKIMVLVEGWDDELVYDQFFNSATVKLVDSGGCDDAVGLNTCINKRVPSIRRIVILDSDFRFFYGRNKKKSNVFFTDTHDLETMIMFSPRCFQNVTHILKCPNVTHQDIVKDLRLLSYIRWYNQDAKMKYNEIGLDIVNMSGVKISDYNVLMHCFTPSIGTTKQWLKRCFMHFRSKHARVKSEHLVNGHDYVDRFCHYAKVRHRLQLSEDDVLLGIAIGCDKVWFQSTRLGKDLMDWQNAHNVTVLA